MQQKPPQESGGQWDTPELSTNGASGRGAAAAEGTHEGPDSSRNAQERDQTSTLPRETLWSAQRHNRRGGLLQSRSLAGPPEARLQLLQKKSLDPTEHVQPKGKEGGGLCCRSLGEARAPLSPPPQPRPHLGFSIWQEEVGPAFVLGAPGPVDEELALQPLLSLLSRGMHALPGEGKHGQREPPQQPSPALQAPPPPSTHPHTPSWRPVQPHLANIL